MIVPSYWAEARTTARAKGRDITLRRCGWSDTSAADARAQAELRVAEAYAACRYVQTLGDGREDPGLLTLVALHDAQSNAPDDIRPLA